MIHYDEYGDRKNPTILLLHGAGALDTFCQQYCFQKQFHLVVPHLCGAGEAVEELYEPKKQMEALFELIRSLNKEKIRLIGHSLGAQLALMLICEHPECFSCAVLLSAWVNPTERSLKPYLRLAPMMAAILHWKWLVRLQGHYWNYSKEQADYMAEYSRHITAEQYRAFFQHTVKLCDYPNYDSLRLPMLAICGSGEVRDMKRSLELLGRNPSCQTMILPRSSHDFPMRAADRLNPILLEFMKRYTQDSFKGEINNEP